MRLQGRDLYIIVGVVAVVIAVMWYFFLFSPERKKMAELSTTYDQQVQTLQSTNNTIRDYQLFQKTAPQAEADLINYSKLMPAENAIPSFIRGLTQTAKASGLELIGITPSASVPGQPFSVQPLALDFDGRYFDAEDFLYRLENYVDYRNNGFLVTGRMFGVVGVAITKGLGDYPDVDVKLTVNGYQWTPTTATTTTTTPAGAP